jgi:Tol biopolymer transport system component
MADLKERFRSLDRVPAPDLWRDISRRQPADLSLGPSWGRVAVAVLALLVAAAGIGVAVKAFVVDKQPRLVGPPSEIAGARNGEIWFRRAGGEGGTWIEAVQPDGSNRRVLFSDTHAGGNDNVGGAYDWTIDGSKLAFLDSSGERIGEVPTGTSWDIFTMNPDGTGRQRVTDDGGFDGPPSWSPDGTRIVYASDLADPNRPKCEIRLKCDRDIFVINADGTERVQLTNESGYDWQPDWSPDGSRMVFVKGGAVFGGDIYTMNPDGTDVTRLTDTPEAESQPRWSPDGSLIAFVRQEKEFFDLYVMDADGSNARLLTTGGPSSHSVEPDVVKDFTWSPDGKLIAFVSGGDVGTTLSTVDVTSGVVTGLVEDPSGIGEPAWRPMPG